LQKIITSVKSCFISAAGLLLLLAAACSGPQADREPFHPTPVAYRLYDGPAPGSEDWDWEEYTFTDARGEVYYANVKDPEVIAYLPPEERATGAAMIVCPGGSFKIHYFTKEGINVAEWLAEQGIAAFVLKYRLYHFAHNAQEAFSEVTGAPGPTYTPAEQKVLSEHMRAAHGLYNDDGRAAIAYVRRHAAEFGVDPDRIGIMGFSAGGILAADVALHHTPENRPNLVAPIYGMAFSLPEKLPADAAPLFVTAPEFDLFPGLTGINMVAAWRQAELPAEAHIFAGEDHGFAYYPESDSPVYLWIDLFHAFMQKVGFLGAQDAQ